jgi:hypothetical protein
MSYHFWGQKDKKNTINSKLEIEINSGKNKFPLDKFLSKKIDKKN